MQDFDLRTMYANLNYYEYSLQLRSLFFDGKFDKLSNDFFLSLFLDFSLNLSLESDWITNFII